MTIWINSPIMSGIKIYKSFRKEVYITRKIKSNVPIIIITNEKPDLFSL